ncbi:hypothetical protein ABRT01_13720 [Lentibacillus sp. L22]|uniref:hypothetical protein n=1 Tax=Lentibacillus TaxID=175304 RepID=UPI0022B0DB04|nr:hypothetical protein [Lentibacillus daqui]
MKEDSKVAPEDGEVSYIGSNVVRYDLKTNQQEKLSLPKELREGAKVESVHGTTLYFTKAKGNQLNIIAYDTNA